MEETIQLMVSISYSSGEIKAWLASGLVLRYLEEYLTTKLDVKS